jgi:hypothetical protein
MICPTEDVLSALRNKGYEPRKAGTGWTCRCPSHDDKTPSLSVSAGADGRALVKCHAGCAPEAIVKALGLSMSDLFPPDPGRRNGPSVTVTKTPRKPTRNGGFGDGDGDAHPSKTFPTAGEAVAELAQRRGKPSKTWTYHNADGEPVGLVLRWDKPGGKEIRPVSKTPAGLWANVGMPAPCPLYALPELLKAKPGDRVYVVEGEKACDAATACGLLATTSAGGAQAAGKTDWSPLAGREVVILPDHDKPGEKYVDDVAKLAKAAGAKSVRVVRLPGLPPKGDIADVLAARPGEEAAIRAEVEALTSEAAPAPAFAPIAASDLIRDYPDLRPVVIADLLREGETMNVVAAPKVGKSWLVHALAVAVVSGRTWLGKLTTKGRVLLIDGELHRETLARRLRTTQETAGVSDSDMSALEVWPVRGQRLTIDAIAVALQDVPEGTYRLIVVDALYRFLPLDGEENANETMTRVYNTLDGIAKRSRASVVVVHHSTKGNQSDKAVTDVGAGAGSQSRAADTHLILRPHEEDDAVVVDAVVRSFAPMESFVIRSTLPGWALAPDLDAALLRKPTRRGKAAKAEAPAHEPKRAWTPDNFATEIVGREPCIRDEVIARAVERGLSKAEADSLLKRALDAGKVHRHQNGPTAPHRFSVDLADAGGGVVVSASPAPSASALGGMGGRALPPSPPSDTPKDAGDGWAEDAA